MIDAARKPSLLIVDDDPLILDTLSYFLSRDFGVSTAASRSECTEYLRNSALPLQLPLIDNCLPPLPYRSDDGISPISSLLAQ